MALEELSLNIDTLGWNSHFSIEFGRFAGAGMVPARVASAHRHIYSVLCEPGELVAEVSGRFRREAARPADFPAVGDWVAVSPRPAEDRATIHALLPRASCFSRKAPGEKTEEQVVAANIDTALIVMSLDRDFNLRRLERYLTLAWGSGVQPVVALNKADLCAEVERRVADTEAAAVGVPVVALSAEEGRGVEELRAHLPAARTAALLGSSGVGKSTIINRLLGAELLATAAVRENDSRGRHTTTHRELIILPFGAIVVDNPGMREVGVWGGEEDLGGAFADIEELAAGCRFSDCRHRAEPGCAVRAAREEGRLSEDRYRSWLKLGRELAFLAMQRDALALLEEKRRMKSLSRFQKSFKKRAR